MNLVLFRYPEKPSVDDVNVVSVSDEYDFFAQYNADAYIVSDFRMLSDLSLILFTTRPTLVILNTEYDFHHLYMAVSTKNFYFSPHDAVYVSQDLEYMLEKYPWVGDHRVSSTEGWLQRILSADSGSTCLFGKFTKNEYFSLFSKNQEINLGNITRFLSICGDEFSSRLCASFINKANILHVNDRYPFSPNIIFCQHKFIDDLNEIVLDQATLVIVPFSCSVDVSVENLIAKIKEQQNNLFLLKNVLTYSQTTQEICGCVIGEFLI